VPQVVQQVRATGEQVRAGALTQHRDGLGDVSRSQVLGS
jgi:hypothetical protein